MKSQIPACSARLRILKPDCRRHGENEVMPVEKMPFIHINISRGKEVLNKESGCPDNWEQFSRIQCLCIYLYTDLELRWHSCMHKIIIFSIYIGFPEQRIRWGVFIYLTKDCEEKQALWSFSNWSISHRTPPHYSYFCSTLLNSARDAASIFPLETYFASQ